MSNNLKPPPNNNKGRAAATFFFIHTKKPQTLSGPAVDVLIEKALVQLAENAEFRTFRAIVQDTGSFSRDEKRIHTRHRLPGEAVWVPPALLRDVQKEKEYHELEHKRTPGHQSTHPPAFLTPETCVLVFGDYRFLGDNAVFYFENTGALRQATIETLQELLGLATSPSKFTSLRMSIEKEGQRAQFYTGYFEQLWKVAKERHIRVSEDELAAKFG